MTSMMSKLFSNRRCIPAVIGLVAMQTAGAAHFELTILTPLEGKTTSQAQYGLNDHGTAVGTSGGEGQRRATLWSHDGKATALAQPKHANFSRATDINDSHVVVGAVDTTGAEDLTGLRAVRWASPERYEFLLQDNGYDSDALSINDTGWVAGIRFNGSTYDAYIASPQGHVEWPTPFSPADDFELLSINRDHVASGFDSNDDGPVAVRWSAQKGVERLALLPGGTISATASINDWGVIAGVADDADGNIRAVRWFPDGKVVALRSLDNAIYSDTQNGINNWGMSVGVTVYSGSDPNEFNAQRATVWDARGQPTDLDKLAGKSSGYTLLTAMAINDCGVIFGDSIDRNGTRYAYRLAPILDRPVRASETSGAEEDLLADGLPDAAFWRARCSSR